MHVITKPSWAISENNTTSEPLFLNRRKFLATALAIGTQAAFSEPLFANKQINNQIANATNGIRYSDLKREITWIIISSAKGTIAVSIL